MPYPGHTGGPTGIACKIRSRHSFAHASPIDASPIIFQNDEKHEEELHTGEVDTQEPQILLANEGVHEEAHEKVNVTELILIEQVVADQDEFQLTTRKQKNVVAMTTRLLFDIFQFCMC